MANAVPATTSPTPMAPGAIAKELGAKKGLSAKAEEALGLITKPLIDGEKIVERDGGIYRERKSVNGKRAAILSSRIG